jgi:hypothetical protein
MKKTNQISHSIEDAIDNTREIEPNTLGMKFHTFRIALSGDINCNSLISAIASHGWHLIGTPLIIENENGCPRHLLISMTKSEPRPLEIRHRLEMNGEIRGQFQAHGEGGSHLRII